MKYSLTFDPSDVTFVVTANNNYNFFIEPFIAFCNESNPGCNIEIWSDNIDDFNYNSKNVKINLLPPNYNVATYRYILEPSIKTKYTYISDIDIMHTELIQPFHLLHMQETDLPFSNIRRTNKGRTTRMSGLHFVESEKWYSTTKSMRENISPNGQDEEMLFQIVQSCYDMNKVSHGLSKRPVHGIHCSVGRNPRSPYASVGWEITSQKIAFFEHVIKKYGVFNSFFETNVCQPLLGQKTITRIKKARNEI
jgi:hypothetical protein